MDDDYLKNPSLVERTIIAGVGLSVVIMLLWNFEMQHWIGHLHDLDDVHYLACLWKNI